MMLFRPLTSVVMFLAVAAAPALVCAQGGPAWADEFDGTTLDPANWDVMVGNGTDYGLPAGWGNNELEYYTGRTENLFVSGGYLHIVARQEAYAGSDYTSARIRTLNRQEFLYGRIEARMKIPSTTGIWPAFWMLPTNSPYGGWAASGEIDIMESVNVADTIYGTIHYGGNWPANAHSGGTLNNGTNFGDAFHVYAIEWEPDSLRWFVDGALYHVESSADWYSTAAPENPRAPFDTPFHILFNVAVGGNFPGGPNGGSVFPQEMLVDWVRVYPYETTQAPFFGTPQVIPGVIEAEDFDSGPDGEAYHDCDSANQGGAYRPASGVDIEACSEGGYNLGWMCAGEWTEYTVDVASAGLYRLDVRVASESTGGTLRVLFDGADKADVVNVPITGGWQSWTTASAVLDLDAGTQIMTFLNTSSSTAQYNVNSFTFTALDPHDLDQDGDVDLADFALLGGCLAGPNVSTPPAGCPQALFDVSDLDGDADMDLQDYANFQRGSLAIP
ncbi:MAG: family 16 glycosylhydrolase [Phycisphaerales bacterium]|nr:family 16 glycosylhydrolase [Phycisphaerales bacterium]